ncbi:hypothetical protein ACHQM5_011429 [Ranunculus cassubicifolius]
METGEIGQTGSNGNGNFAWVFRDSGSNIRSFDSWNNNSNTSFMLGGNSSQETYHHHHQENIFSGNSHHHHLHHPDPHLTCLKLGKRHYFEDGNGGIAATGNGGVGDRQHIDGFQIEKRGRSFGDGFPIGISFGPSSVLPVPRCQVEGCHVALVNAKDYHRRHKVCEMHSKAPKVVVLGIEQRFCQQCSRFHVVSEFDDSKRSCRRRLAGHNERRRKSSNDSMSRNLSQEHRSMSGRLPYISPSTGRALSLLSSKTNSWVSPSDLSSRSSAALRELIAENRAAVLARQLFLDQGWHHQAMDEFSSNHQQMALPLLPNQHQGFPNQVEWERFNEAGGQVTLDLMQEPSSAFGFLSGRTKSKEEEDCSEIWRTLEGTHVV